MPRTFNIHNLRPAWQAIAAIIAVLCVGISGVTFAQTSYGSDQDEQQIPKLPFPKELTGIRISYVKSLESLEEELWQKRAELKKQYHAALDELGRDYIKDKDQAAALAVKIEQQRLRDAGGFYPNADAEGGRPLQQLRYRYIDGLAAIHEEMEEKFRDRADEYLQKLDLWVDLYEKRRDRTNAAAVQAEIESLEARLKGQSPAQTTPVAQNSPATEPASAPEPSPAPAEPVAESPVNAPPTSDPATAEAPAEVDPDRGQLVLAEEWEISDGTDGSLIKAELNKLFSRFGKPEANLRGYPGLPIYGDIFYLMPREEAVKQLDLLGVTARVADVETPGLPADSLTAHYYPRKIADQNDKMEFNGVTLVTDQADQVVCLQFHLAFEGSSLQYRLVLDDYQVYDYLFLRRKEAPVHGIWHKLHSRNLAGEYVEEAENLVNPNPNGLRLDSLYFLETLEVKAMVRWYIPRPFVDVILLSSST